MLRHLKKIGYGIAGHDRHDRLMPQYNEPVSIPTTRTLLDVIRNYPDYPMGWRR